MKRLLTILTLIPILCFPQSILRMADSVRMTRGIPGMVYAAFSGDSVFEQGLCGYREVGTRKSIQYRDRFNIGTNAAAFTAYIAGVLIEKKKIDWTTKLLDVYPEAKKFALPVYLKTTLLDLLSNQSHAPLLTTLDEWFRLPASDGSIVKQRRDFTYFMLRQKPFVYNPLGGGQKINFSYAAFTMAASMLEKVSGKSWETLVDDLINKPLGISVKFGWPANTDSSAPLGHWQQAGSFHAEQKNTWLQLSGILNPSHNINISLPDYIVFMQENLNGLLGKKAHLTQETFQYLHFGILDYAMGWNNGSLEEYSYSFHEGKSPLFDCRAEIIKEKNLGIIVMCNSGDHDGRGGVLNLCRLIEEKYLTQ